MLQWALRNMRRKSQHVEIWGKALKQGKTLCCPSWLGQAKSSLPSWYSGTKSHLTRSLSWHQPLMTWDIYDVTQTSRDGKEYFNWTQGFWHTCHSLAKINPNQTLKVYLPTVNVTQGSVSNRASTWNSSWVL